MHYKFYTTTITATLIIILTLCQISQANNLNLKQYKTLMDSMDPSADPCTDYYRYACGHWEKRHADKDYYVTIGYVDKNVNWEYARLLKNLKKHQRAQYEKYKFLKNLHGYHKSCRNLPGYEPIKYLNWLEVHAELSWPSVMPPQKRKSRKHHKKQRNNYDWLHMLATLRKYGLNGVFLDEIVLPHREDARISYIDLDKPVLNDGFIPMKRNNLETILQYLNIEDQSAIGLLWQQIESFEKKLQQLNEVQDEEGYELLTLAELKVPWLQRYISIIMEQQQLDDSFTVSIQNKAYLASLHELLTERTDPEFLCRYIMLRFLLYLDVESPNDFDNLDCIKHLRSSLPLAMQWLYGQNKHSLVQDHQHIEDIFQKLLHHFTVTLRTNTNRFNTKILQFLEQKLATIYIKIGNLPRNSTNEQVEAFYDSLTLNSNDFYANHLKVLYFSTKKEHERLQTLTLPDDNFVHLEDYNTAGSSSPYYLLSSNVVIVPETILQLPIYHRALHGIFQYSALGFLLAHEITHGFDDSGVEFDQWGNMYGPVEMIRANRKFDANMKCLSSMNPKIIDEKIADVSGLRWAYETYFKNNHTLSDSKSLHCELELENALESENTFSYEKLFFLNFAQFFCGTNDEDLLDFREHGSDRQRVIDALANFEHFGRVYQCPVGSRMNPKRKCQLWR